MDHFIDFFEEAKIVSRDDQQNASGMALLLDFAKTYDSLGRSFPLAALRYLGKPRAFIYECSVCRLQEEIASALHCAGHSEERPCLYTQSPAQVAHTPNVLRWLA